MIFEDLHWIDPTSREALDLAVEGITDLPVLLVATYGPEFQPPWAGQSQVTVITLNRLHRSEGAAMVHRIAGNFGTLPRDVVDEIVERTYGVPLFVEEVTKAERIDRLGPAAKQVAQVGAAMKRRRRYLKERK